MAAPDTIAPALLAYLNDGVYPESDAIASAALSSDALSSLVVSLNKAQDEIKAEIRSQSRTTAPDIDSWIKRAKELQADILRSRETARQIVAEAEAGEELKAAQDDTEKKVRFLEREVTFNETLYGTLEHVSYASGLLRKVQDDAVTGNVDKALDRLEDAEASIAGLQSIETTKVYELLHHRARSLKENLVETATECWNALIHVSQEENQITIKQALSADVPEAVVSEVTVADLARAVQRLGIFDTLTKKLSKDIERAIVKPRLVVDDAGLVAKLEVSERTLSCASRAEIVGIVPVLDDLRQILGFLASRLPSAILLPLSEWLLPTMLDRLERYWLESTIPDDMSHMSTFQTTLGNVSEFAEYIDSLGWNGSNVLYEWIENAPRAWLTKRRETVLGDVRNLVFSGLRETKVVERVETQMMSREEVLAATNGAVGNDEDDWGAAWDDPEEESSTEVAPANDVSGADDDEDMSAWDVDDNDAKSDKADDDDTSAWDMDDSSEPNGAANDEEDAWGWGDEETKSTEPAATTTKASSKANVNGDKETGEREMTLRETFTVTGVPDGVLEIIQQLVSDAEVLAGPDYSFSSIAPAAGALYTLPSLALAIYRATAPTAYAKLDTGKMLIYNDSSRLADQLRAWQSTRAASSRLRLDNDVKALEVFAKSAYSSEMEAQRTILRDLIDGAQGFSNCTVAPYKAECESAVDQTIDRLRDVYKQWKDILSQSALLQSVGSLLASVTAKIMLDIEDLGDIGEADSHQLKALIDRTISVKEIFQQPAQGSSGDAPDMTFIYCPNWTKFLYMAEILESSLADIKYMWNEGELSLEYDADEVVELVEALFAESELRRQAIREIRRGGRV